MLQPGRLVMPDVPDPAPEWMQFFPVTGDGPLARAMAGRFAAYCQQVARELADPAFAGIDHMIVLADVLSALHDGRDALNEAMAALRAVGKAVNARQGGLLAELLGSILPIAFGIERVAIAATKSDHVAERQRGNLRGLVRDLAGPGLAGRAEVAPFAIASVRCTEDAVMTLDGRPVSAVRGRLLGRDSFAKSYPGEVPDRVPGAEFWQHGFYQLPAFEPVRPHAGGAGGIAHIDLDRVLAFILAGILPDE
jgi:predicted YcjX-like family ATPase